MRTPVFVAALMSSALGAAFASPALSQNMADAASTGNEDMILVTARRREESVQDIPIMVSVLSAREIEARGINSVEDIARNTPGLVFDRGISLQDTRPVIRGLPATRGRPPVGILLDGIDISTEALGNAGGGSLVNQRLLDVERIEVVKGPQSALYGRAAFAGAINYVSKRPTETLQAEVRGSYASFNTFDINGSISGPINEKFGFRVQAGHFQTDGDYDNPVTGGNLNALETTGGAVSLSFDSQTGVEIFTRVSYVDFQASQNAIQNLGGFIPGNVSRPGAATPEGQAIAAGIAGGALAPGSLASNMPPRGDLRFTGVTGLSIDPRTGTDFSGSNGNTLTATLNLSADLGPFTFVYNGGYVRQQERLVYDGDFFGRPLAALTGGTAEPLNIFDVVDFKNNVEIINQEVRFQKLDGGPLRWAVGGLYWESNMQQDNSSLRAISGFPLSGTPFSAAGSAQQLFARSASLASPFARRIESLSAYALIEYDLTPELTISAEGRYIHETTRVTRSDFVQTAFAPLSSTFVNPVQRDNVSDSDFVPRGSLTWKPNNDVLVYASAAKGFKPAGISELDFGSPLVDSRFKAETVWNYEAGFKSSFADRQITLNGAVFFMDWTDKQVSQLVEDPAAPGGFRASVRNAGAAEVLGLEAMVTLRPRALSGLTVDVGYTFLDTKYTDFTVNSNSTLTIAEAANCTPTTVGASTVCSVTFNGNQLERAPKHQLVANLNYRAELGNDIALTFGASAQYLSDRFLQEDNRMVLPAYVNVDMQVGVEYKTFMLQGFVTNLTANDTVRTAQNNFDLSTFGRSVNIYAPPRRAFGVRGRVRF